MDTLMDDGIQRLARTVAGNEHAHLPGFAAAAFACRTLQASLPFVGVAKEHFIGLGNAVQSLWLVFACP